METIKGFSQLNKEQRITWLSQALGNDLQSFRDLLASFWHAGQEQQKTFDEFSENTISNFILPFGVAPNFLINGKIYSVPIVTEESSVVAAACAAAKFWLPRGGLKAQVLGTTKVGQVHFFWPGSGTTLQEMFEQWRPSLIKKLEPLMSNMQRRGGGIKRLQLLDKTHKLPNYYQLFVELETCNAMGANFINSILEALGQDFSERVRGQMDWPTAYREIEITMCILSNYTPDCLVHVQVDCPISEFDSVHGQMSGTEFVRRFKRAVDIAQVDPYRATTHNKGIFNGVDGVVMATGNDFRAVEACGHAYAAIANEGYGYRGLTCCHVENEHFVFSLNLPLALGTVGGLTSLHPLAKLSLEMLKYPSAQELMMVAASVGLAQNFAALKSLVTTGIQQGHMKMHLLNILNTLEVNEGERKQVKEHFEHRVVTFSEARNCLTALRERQ